MKLALATAALVIVAAACGGRSAPPAPSRSAALGQAIAQKYRCTDCHTIAGRGATYGPDITRAWTRFVDRAGGDEATARSAMMAFLQHPSNATTDGRQMPDFHMTPSEAGAVVEYLKWTASR